MRDVARRAVIHAANMMNVNPRSLFADNAEPPLDEVMGDPMVRDLMARDGVAEDSLRVLIDSVRIRLR
ncbi:hypothetical protein CU669_01420 [Paramagnetospirillum kuznetsovii]|uniref:Uncharacterized protein n=1 Tax=Paramagnetospirillum kuznetsovii TaxID=2053833 RepID=A0A364P350_9PROT|nr:hypothetical protein CU669_01420 [Paramagnetospirillum kuznetsovii]